MGEQTSIVIVGFLVVNIAVILSIVSMGTPDWIRGEQNMTLVPASNGTQNLTTKGFWQICEAKTCMKLNQTIQTDHFRASQVLFTIGSGFGVLGALVMYAYLGMQALRTSLKASFIGTTSFMLSSFCLLTAVIIYGVRAKNDNPDLDENLVIQLSWSYYTGIAAVVFCFLSTFAVGRRTHLVRGRTAGYEDI